MKKTTKRNLLGMLVYMTIALVFGGGFGLLALIVKEDNDRCHYYGGTWNRGDLVRGCLAVGVGMGLRYWAFGLLSGEQFAPDGALPCEEKFVNLEKGN